MITSCIDHVKAKVAAVSWGAWLVTLFLIFHVLQLVVTEGFHTAMYSPLNFVAYHKQKYHDEVLARAGLFLATRRRAAMQSNMTIARTTNSSQTLVRSIVMLVSQRKRPYLNVCLWSLLQGNSKHDVSTTMLTVLNTERPPENNVDLLQWQPILVSFSSSSTTRIMNAQDSKAGWMRREVEDYRQAIEACLADDDTVPWCIIFEEDALLTRNFVSKFHTTVETSEQAQQQQQQQQQHREIGMIKLFVADHYDGFSTSWQHVQEIGIVAVVAWIFVVLLVLAWPNNRSTIGNHYHLHLQHYPGNSHRQGGVRRKLLAGWIISLIGIYSLCRIMGRQTILHLLEPRGLRLVPIPSTAGTVGIAFPRSVLPGLHSYLSERLDDKKGQQKVENIDLMLNSWIETYNLQALRTKPSLVQHIGAFSSSNVKNQGNFEFVKQDSTFVF